MVKFAVPYLPTVNMVKRLPLDNCCEQNKNAEMRVSKKGLQDAVPEDFDLQEEVKRMRLLQLKLLHLKGHLILDAACGPGTYGIILAEQGNDVVGVDLSPDVVKMAKNRLKRRGLNSNFMPIVADIEHLPLRDNVFDVCFVGWALHHFPRIRVVGRFFTVLKDRGILAIAEPNELHPALILSRYFEKIFKRILGESGLFTDNVSIHPYYDYCKNLIQQGFTITMLTTSSSVEPVIIPRSMSFIKKSLLQYNVALRDILCISITAVKTSLNGTDLLILAYK